MSTSKKSLFEIYRLNKQKYLAYISTHGWKQKLIRDVHSKTIYTLHGLILLNSFYCIIFSNNSFLKQENEKKMEKYSQQQKGKTIQNLQAEKEKELERTH